MKYFGNGLSEQHKALNLIVRKRDKFTEAKQLFLDLHAKLHLSVISSTMQNETDALLLDLSHNELCNMPTAKDKTIAWTLWHIARIEDLTIGILAAEGEQLFNAEWKNRLNANITDTGNALDEDEIMALSLRLNAEELLEYRNAVGRKTRDIVSALSASDMTRKVSPASLQKIMREGGLTEQDGSRWLLDYWGGKDVAGLLLMPPTRHLIVHLNECAKWKQQIRAGKKCHRDGR
jgi:hypothetical protein